METELCSLKLSRILSSPRKIQNRGKCYQIECHSCQMREASLFNRLQML